MWIDPGYGYHVDNTSGLATGAEEESIYAVMSGTHYNQHCCFVRASPPLTLPRVLVLIQPAMAFAEPSPVGPGLRQL